MGPVFLVPNDSEHIGLVFVLCFVLFSKTETAMLIKFEFKSVMGKDVLDSGLQ